MGKMCVETVEWKTVWLSIMHPFLTQPPGPYTLLLLSFLQYTHLLSPKYFSNRIAWPFL